jgi:hypothetical protein
LKKGAIVFYSFPPYPISEIEKSFETIKTIYTTLKTIKNLHVIDDPMKNAYKKYLFYNAKYHLTGDGATKRTNSLINSFKKYLNYEERKVF